VIDLGTHIDERFKNDKGEPSRKHKIQIQWELPGSMMEYKGEQKPMMATKRYSLSVHEKASLRKDLESWYGKTFDDRELEAKGFDVEKLLGRPALLNISHSEDGKYANIKSVNPPMKGVEQAPQLNASRLFDLDAPSAAVWATLSDKTREFISKCEEVKSGKAILPGNESAEAFRSTDEDIPF
jgi:hypothetical protein